MRSARARRAGFAAGAEARRERGDVALDDDVELARRAPEQQVAHRAADEVHPGHARRGREQALAAGQLAQALAQVIHGDSLAHGRSDRAWTRPGPANATRPASTILRVSPSPRGERPLPRLAIGAVLLVLGVGVALAVFDRDDNTFNPDVGFVDTNEDTPSATASRPRADEHPADDGFSWPIYGYSKARTHHLAIKRAPRPPYRQAWAVRGKVLLEFSPVLCGRRVYLLKNNGALYAISRNTGRVSWTRKLGSLAAASPACDRGTIYAVLLKRFSESGGGRVIAVAAKDGHTRWSRRLPSRSESSPLVDRGRVYIGSEDGTVYSLRTRDGQVRWRAKAAGAVKGAIALDAGKLYFGDYGGKVHAIRRSNGTKVWEKSPAGGGALGIGGGNFYSSAAVEYGRVYIGSTNGTVYSLSSSDGKLAWSRSTGGYVYASPAVGQVRGGKPTVYIGSYDGNFYALDARTGRPRWVRSLGSKISGRGVDHRRPRVRLGPRQPSTWALGARTGKTVWKTHRGALQPGDQRRAAHLLHRLHVAVRARPDGAPVRSLGEVTRPRRRGRRGPPPPAARARAKAARQRAAQRKRARAIARRQRQLRFRFAPHGHRHSGKLGYKRSCHRHRHVYKVRGKTIVLRHSHCHSHIRARPGALSQARTAMPAAARCSFASRMRYVP